MEYEEKLAKKAFVLKDSGFEISEESLHPELFPFQKFCVKRALKKGRYALFQDCGLGKTFQQLEWGHQVVKSTGLNVLILAPLAVVAQTIEQGEKWGIETWEWDPGSVTETNGVYISNYDQLQNIIDTGFIGSIAGVILDESSILKAETGATRNLIIETFRDTDYKLCCTATPSPNDPDELGNHSEFLGVMGFDECRSMFFKHDGGETSKWRLKGHCQNLFWEWVSTWAVMLSKPSDIGFSDEGYNLPGLNLIERQVKTEQRENGQLFNDTAISATNFNQELRLTQVKRLDEVAEIVNNSTESFVIWVKHNQEGDDLRRMIPGAIEVKGGDSPNVKLKNLMGFAHGEFRVLITKVKIAGFGLNFQGSHNMVFASPDFSFEGIYQALRRQLRFGQKSTVNAYLITTDTMANVMESFKRKKQQHETMQHNMQLAMNASFETEKKTIRPERTEIIGDATISLGDSIQLIQNVPNDSIGFSIWSPPFPELYVYSDEPEDLGNCKNFDEFTDFFSHIPHRLFPKMWAGRNVAIHCMDTPIQKGKEGYIGLRDFSGMIIQKMQEAGFIYHSRVTLWKDPVVEMQRTKALGLLHKQVKKDSAMSRVGIPDYLLVFRKPGEHEHPVKCDIPVDVWQKYASPVWMDIDQGDTLNARAGRDDRDEKHICPLQLETIKRATHLWTNKGDTVLTMFLGIGSEAYQAVCMGRKAIGFELKQSYFDQAVKNLKAAAAMKAQASIF